MPQKNRTESSPSKRRLIRLPSSKKRAISARLSKRFSKTKKDDNRSPREVAIDILSNWIENKTRVDLKAQSCLKSSNWGKRDRNQFLELLYGSVRLFGRLEWIFKKLNDGEKAKEVFAEAAIIIGIYQILFLDRIPDYAAVDGSVSTVKEKLGESEAHWVNALLRRLCRDDLKRYLRVPKTDDDCYNLSIEYSHPKWMVERWSSLLSRENLLKFLSWNNRRPEIIFRVNRRRTTGDIVIDKIMQEGISVNRSKLNPFFLILEHSGDLKQLNLIESGLAVVQDHAQGLIGEIVNPKPGEEILDLCSAPGGKTGHLAEICPECKITATDRNDQRLFRVKKMVEQQAYKNVKVIPYDQILAEKKRYDAVLIDAPCTGTGVLARRPDLRWRRDVASVKRMASAQQQILKYGANRVKIGGRLIYSTCSVEPEENQSVVDSFIEEYKQFKEVSVEPLMGKKFVDKNGRLSLYGFEMDSDGVFAAKLERFK